MHRARCEAGVFSDAGAGALLCPSSNFRSSAKVANLVRFNMAPCNRLDAPCDPFTGGTIWQTLGPVDSTIVHRKVLAKQTHEN